MEILENGSGTFILNVRFDYRVYDDLSFEKVTLLQFCWRS